MTITIRAVASADKPTWTRLWDQYLAFYETKRGQGVKDAAWARILDPDQPMHSCLAVAGDGEIIGLANFLFHPSFWEVEDVCYLNDLYVLPSARGRGAARALVAAVAAKAAEKSARKVYWLTAQDNHRARGLYDKIAKKTPFVHYVM